MNVRTLAWILPVSLALCACATTKSRTEEDASRQALLNKRLKGPTNVVDDHSMCDWKGRPDREVKEVKGPGSASANVRRVYQKMGTGESAKRILNCREMDTNFDGIKDVVRRYNDKGESVHEESDSNFDGRIDTWITFARGMLAEVIVDNDYDGRPDEQKTYSDGRLMRVRRDSNHDGRPDVWEVYRDGRLERMGIDVDGDERVDRWAHDTDVRRKLDEEERRKEEAEKAEAAKKEAKKKEEEGEDGDKPKKGSVKGRGASGKIPKDAPKETTESPPKGAKDGDTKPPAKDAKGAKDGNAKPTDAKPPAKDAKPVP
jgi:hypothetical protein